MSIERAKEVAESFADQDILNRIRDERQAQREKWGIQSLPLGFDEPDDWQVAAHAKKVTDANMADGSLTWRDVLAEEYFESLAEGEHHKIIEELIQVAAVAVAIIRDIESGRVIARGR